MSTILLKHLLREDPLTPEEKTAADKIMDDSSIAFTIGDDQIKHESLRLLKTSERFDDALMNASCLMIMHYLETTRSKLNGHTQDLESTGTPQVYIFRTYLSWKVSENEKDTVVQWIRKHVQKMGRTIETFTSSVDKLMIFPVHSPGHWSMVYIDQRVGKAGASCTIGGAKDLEPIVRTIEECLRTVYSQGEKETANCEKDSEKVTADGEEHGRAAKKMDQKQTVPVEDEEGQPVAKKEGLQMKETDDKDEEVPGGKEEEQQERVKLTQEEAGEEQEQTEPVEDQEQVVPVEDEEGQLAKKERQQMKETDDEEEVASKGEGTEEEQQERKTRGHTAINKERLNSMKQEVANFITKKQEESDFIAPFLLLQGGSTGSAPTIVTSEQLEKRMGTSIRPGVGDGAQDMRKRVCEMIQADGSLHHIVAALENTRTGQELSEVDAVDSYVAYMSTPSAFGDDVEIKKMAEILGGPVAIFQHDHTTGQCTFVTVHGNHLKGMVTFLIRSNVHSDSKVHYSIAYPQNPKYEAYLDAATTMMEAWGGKDPLKIVVGVEGASLALYAFDQPRDGGCLFWAADYANSVQAAVADDEKSSSLSETQGDGDGSPGLAVGGMGNWGRVFSTTCKMARDLAATAPGGHAWGETDVASLAKMNNARIENGVGLGEPWKVLCDFGCGVGGVLFFTGATWNFETVCIGVEENPIIHSWCLQNQRLLIAGKPQWNAAVATKCTKALDLGDLNGITNVHMYDGARHTLNSGPVDADHAALVAIL